jgi:hypothetical protein
MSARRVSPSAEAIALELLRRKRGASAYLPHTPHPKQAEFLALDCLEALYGGAAGGGKSDALLMAALQYAHVPGYSAILFRRTYTDLSLPGAIMDRSHEWLGGSDAKWNDRDKTWAFPSGASLTFGYLDGPRDHIRYQGAEFQFVGFDELTQFLERQYTYLFSRLRRVRNIAVPLRMRAASNPGDIGHEWVKRRFVDAPGERVFVPATLEDNPSLDAVEYETALAKLDPVTQQQLRWGSWVRDTTGLVYSSWSDRLMVGALPELQPGERWQRVLACDFGVTDPTAFVELAFTEHDPRVFVTRSEQWVDLAPSEAAAKAKAWEASAGGYDRIIGDTGGLGKGFEAEWRKRFYIPMHAAQKADKLGYIKLLNGDLHNGLVAVLPGNELLVEHLRALPWADDRHTREHPAMPNHLPDALLYGWREARHWAWETRPEVRAIDEHERKAIEAFDQEQSREWWEGLPH